VVEEADAVWMEDLPLPSTLSRIVIRVSLVTRFIWACRCLIFPLLKQTTAGKTKPNPVLAGLAHPSPRGDAML
jgi:hypothetical protein